VLFENLTARTPWSRERLMQGIRKPEDFLLPASVFTNVPQAIADDVQQHMMRIGDPDPTKRPTTAQALAESQRLRERIIASSAV
jgi:hypothetical protein